MNSNRTLIQMQPDIIVKKLQSTTSGNALLNEVLDADHPSPSGLIAPDIAVRGSVTIPTTTDVSYAGSWNIGSLVGKFNCSRNRYSLIKRNYLDCPSKRQEFEEITGEYWGPSWLINRVWRIRAMKVSSGWSFCTRTHNIVPSESPVFGFAKNDDVKGLQELFARGEASPLDCSERDYTALDVRMS